MKKIFSLAAVLSIVAFVGCEDVPAPYELLPEGGNGGNGGGGTTSSLPYTSTNLSDWNVVTVKGTPWSLGNTYAKASGYNSGTTTETETWLVSDAINTTTEAAAAHFTLEHVIAYVKSDAPLTNHTMWVSTEYANDVATATWTQLDYKPVERTNTSSWDFYAADEIALPAAFLNQNIYVAFKFVCGTNSTTWELKNFNLLEGEAAAGNGGGDNGGGDNPPSTDPAETISIADFLAKKDTETTYRLVGTVKNIANTTYGNFDLVDGDASIFIYGLLDKDGAAQKFASLGIAEGDSLTLEGKYVDYNGKAEIKNAQYISHVSMGGGTSDGGGDNTGGNTGGGDPVASITNGDFETWEGNLPTGWKSACSASSATLSQSTDAHGGTYSVQVDGASANKRLAYKETTFEAGTYNVKFYAKSLGGATSSYGPQTKAGYVPVDNGSVGSYAYASAYTNLSETEWTEVTYSFTLDAATTICLVVMNPKNSGNMLIDDYTITKQ